MGIAIHNLSSSGGVAAEATDLAAAVRQTAVGILGTTVQLADLVRFSLFFSYPRGYPLYCQVLPQFCRTSYELDAQRDRRVYL